MSCLLISPFSRVTCLLPLSPSSSSPNNHLQCRHPASLPSHACSFFSIFKFLNPNSKPNSSFLRLRSSFPLHFRYPAFCFNDTSDCSFSSSNGISDILSKETVLSSEEIQQIVCKNDAINSYSVDHIRTRISSICSIGIKDAALARLIAECPQVLTSVEVEPVIECFRGCVGGEIEPAQIYQVLSLTNFGLLTDFAVKFKLLTECGIPESKTCHIVNNVNLIKAICQKSIEEIRGALNFFDRHSCIDMVVRWPPILNLDMDTQLIPKFNFLTELNGGSEIKSIDLLRKLPRVLRYSLRHMETHAEFFREFAGITNEEVFKVMVAFPAILSVSTARKISPRLKFLKQCGLNAKEICKYMVKWPLFMGLSFRANLAHKIGMLMKIGYKHGTKDLATAVGATTRTNCGNLQMVIDLLLRYGFGFDNIVFMSTRHPQMLQYTYESIVEKMEYLVVEMGRNVEELIAFPAYLGYNFRDRIKHRHELTKDSTGGSTMSINSLLALSTQRFMSRQEKHLR